MIQSAITESSSASWPNEKANWIACPHILDYTLTATTIPTHIVSIITIFSSMGLNDSISAGQSQRVSQADAVMSESTTKKTIFNYTILRAPIPIILIGIITLFSPINITISTCSSP